MITAEYIRGLIDGEGCFLVNARKDNRGRKNNENNRAFVIDLKFFIALRDDNYHLLEAVRDFFGCGRIEFAVKPYGNKKPQWRYVVASKNDLRDIIVPFFEKYSLIGAKRFDFELFKEAINIVCNKKHLTLHGRNSPQLLRRVIDSESKGFKRLQEITKLINTYRGSSEPKSKSN